MTPELQPPSSGTSDLIQSNVGWAVAVVTGIWGYILRLLLGRHLDAVDRVERKLDDVLERVARLEGVHVHLCEKTKR